MDLSRERAAGTLGVWAAGALVVLLPFEPSAPLLRLAGFGFTSLEAAAGAAGLLLAWDGRARLVALLRRPPPVLVLASAFGAANVVAALLAPAYRGQCLHFALRACVLAVFAWVFAAAGPRARRAGLTALAAAGTLVALASAAEGAGVTRLDPLLDAFREMRFNVGGARRGTGGTAYPTLAGAWIASALVAAAALARAHRRPGLVAGAAAAVMMPGLLFTYSRGALAAALAGLCALAALAWRARDRPAARAAGAALIAGALCAIAFALRGEVFRLRLAGDGTAAWYAGGYAAAERGLVMRPGETRRTAVQVANAGLKAWAPADGFALSYHWFDPVRGRLIEGGRTPLPRTLARGDRALLRPLVQAPPQPGCYLLVWDMVQEHTTWLSGQGVPTANVPAVVGGADQGECLRALPPSVRVGGQPERRELWPAALAMVRDRPWTGMGPDNFRRLFGHYAGRPFWDDRVTANNLFLETAAGTGVLGVLALAGMLAAASAGALRLAAASDPAERTDGRALVALLAAFLAHGAVDYLLGVTGPYLLLAFVAGAAAPARAAEAAAWDAWERGAA